MKTDFYYQSSDGITNIHAVEWKPQGIIKGILQISHGMVEYIDRYNNFANFMMSKGFYVVGQDHLGHGESVLRDELHGFFHETKGNECVVEDIHRLYMMTKDKYPKLPYYILGHSMGSFLTRQYIKTYEVSLNGVIIMGTGHQPPIMVSMGKLLCSIIAGVKGWKYRSRLVDNMAFGSYNKRFEPARTSKDWLTRESIEVDKYINHPWCTFCFTVSGYYQMFRGMQELEKTKNLEQIPKNLPILFISGKDDPVGNFGKSVEKVCKKYKDCGIKDISLKLYEDGRHEILNEINKEQVYQDIYAWIQEKPEEKTP